MLTSMMLKKMTRGQWTVMWWQPYVAVTLSRLSTPPFVFFWAKAICGFLYSLVLKTAYLCMVLISSTFYPFLGAIGDYSGSVSEGKHWSYLLVLHHKRLRGKLWLVCCHCPQHRNLSFHQFLIQGIQCEKMITCNVITIQSFSHV